MLDEEIQVRTLAGFVHQECVRVFQIALRGGRTRNFTRGRIRYLVMGTWEGVILTLQTFFKAKYNYFCKYLASIKIKISMICVYKEYEIVQEQWLQLKVSFYWVITWKLLLSGGGIINLWWVRIKMWLRRVYGGGVWANF